MQVCKYFRFTAAALLADTSHHPRPYCKYNFFQHKVYLEMKSGRQPAVAAVSTSSVLVAKQQQTGVVYTRSTNTPKRRGYV